MPYAYTLVTTIPASAQDIYDAWLDSLAHSEMTQAPASMSDEVGAEVSAWDGYITGRNLELTPAERIVQSWRTEEFDDEHEDSIVTLTLDEIDDGTLLTLVHTNVPDGHTGYEQGGWEEHYFEPMKAYFASRQQADVEEPAKEAPSTAKRGAGRTKGAVGKKRARGAAGKKKIKRAAPKAKAKKVSSKSRAKPVAGSRRKSTTAKVAKRKRRT